MSFGKAIQNTCSDALAEFALAQMKYKRACSVYARVRQEIVGDNESDAAIIKNHKAKKIFRQECRDYAEARAKYINAVRIAAAKLPRVTNDELFDLTVETRAEAIHLALKEEAIARSITPEEIEVAKRVTAERQRVKDSFLSHENTQSEIDSDKIQFDPEFDKL